MNAVIQRTVTVSLDGKIEIDVPELLPGSTATITITFEAAPQPKRFLADVSRNATPGPHAFRTVEEVDAYIREERDSWDDE